MAGLRATLQIGVQGHLISSQSDLKAFAKYIGFNLDRKDQKLKSLVERVKTINTNVDVFPLPVEYIKSLCMKFGLYQKNLAKAAGVNRSLISMYLNKKRINSKIIKKVSRKIFIPNCDKKELHRLSNIFCIINDVILN